MLSGHSFNALLKTLEEPPPHVKFLLATTDPQRLPVTVLSRCLQFNLKSLTLAQITGQLEMILAQEGIHADAGALRELALAANGSMRDALSLLDQAIAFCAGDLGEAEVRSMLGTIDRDVIYRLLDALAANDAARLLAEIGAADDFAPDYAALLGDTVSLLQRIAVAQTLPDAIDDSYGGRQTVLELAGKLSPEDVQLYYQIGLIGRRDLSLSPEPRGGFEMVMLRMLAFRPAAAGQSVGEPRQASAPTRPAAGKPPAMPAKADPASPPAGNSPDTQQQANPPGQAAPRVEAESVEWATIIGRLNLTGMVREMALNCAFHGMEGDKVRLSMEDVHARLHSTARMKQLEAALCEHFGRSITVKLVHERQLEKETPARRQSREQQERQQRAVASITGDVNIKAIQERFGATVNEESIRPKD
jgi:DNA polymerase-3 subunit gamma/tau